MVNYDPKNTYNSSICFHFLLFKINLIPYGGAYALAWFTLKNNDIVIGLTKRISKHTVSRTAYRIIKKILHLGKIKHTEETAEAT